ncbi:MAG: sulfite exporter TauE/SafE family protein [Planctomycetota bacterium]|jgi:uncharacterized membrane protein YfcA
MLSSYVELHWMPVLVVAGAIAGAINSVAGGGSLLTLPAMIFLGIPGPIANGTNRIGIATQCLAAHRSFVRLGVKREGVARRLVLPTTIGTIVGAYAASHISTERFNLALGVILVAMAFVVMVDKERWLRTPAQVVENAVQHMDWRHTLLFLGLGLYGGFLQAGVGIFFLAALVLGCGLDVVRANAVKALVMFVYTAFAVGLFAYYGKIDWAAGIALAIGQAIGGTVGARLAVAKGAGWIRVLLILMVLASAAKLILGEVYSRG